MNLPFKMITETKLEQWRHDTFWDKEPETISWLQSFSDGDVFFDIGANIGVYSLYCAALYPNSQILAFEPHNGNFNRLMDNIRLNGFKNIDPYNKIISDKHEKCDFTGQEHEVGASGGQMVAASDSCTDYSRSVDDLVFFSFNVPVPYHIKIDIDGQELKVIRGMEKTLPLLSSVLVEVRPESKDEIVAIMLKAGLSMDNRFNVMTPHSRERRQREGIPDENIIFTR